LAEICAGFELRRRDSTRAEPRAQAGASSEDTALGRYERSFLADTKRPTVGDGGGRAFEAAVAASATIVASTADPSLFRRSSARSRHTRRVHMGRSTFIKLVAGWSVALIILFALALVLRTLG
jgi:hypothetical protein